MGAVTKMFRAAFAVLVVAATAGVAACSSSSAPASPAAAAGVFGSPSSVSLPTSPPAGAQKLSEAGSTLLLPLFNEWASAYQSRFSNVAISVAGGGSTQGVTLAASGQADIGASDAYLSSAKLAKYPTLENIPLAISAQFIAYNLPSVTGNLKLNSTVLADMYQGKITAWNDARIKALNPGVSLPPTKVVPIHRKDGSGDTFLFTSYLSTDSNWSDKVGFSNTVAWPAVPGATSETGNGGMVSGCVAHPGCVAYIGISYLSPANGLGEAQLLNSSGQYELPDASSINAAAGSFVATTPVNGSISLIDSTAANGYPIINYEYAIVSTHQPNATKAATIKALLNWILTDGSSPAYLAKVGFQSLPSQVATIAKTLIAKIG
jgi:phosphate transport system substrate-binding protein